MTQENPDYIEEKTTNQIVQWLPVTLPEYRDLYEVSNFGQVRRRDNGLILRSSHTGIHRNLQIKLRRADGVTKNCMIAHLTMAAWVEDPCGRPIGFLDKNQRNCSATNLYFLKKASASGGGHTDQMLTLKIEDVARLIWEDLLKNIMPLFISHATCTSCKTEPVIL